MIPRAYFLITDISGYTMFLTRSELEHAQHIIEALFDAQLKTVSAPVKVSNFQGDAILCYIDDDQVTDALFPIKLAQRMYAAFQNTIGEMLIDPPCGCKACANINMLDLKIFIHHGEYLAKQVGDREEILGADVILAHRMMKNKVVEQTGLHSYLLLTDTVFDCLPDDQQVSLDFREHVENYDHIGNVPMHVGPLTVT